MSKILTLSLASAILAAAAPASAAVVYSDTFDGYPNGLNFVAFNPEWSVANGTVDMIGSPPPFFDLIPGNGHYVDLDGSTGNAGELTLTLNLAVGDYVISFELGGSHRGDTNTVDFTGPAGLDSYVLASADPFATRFAPFTILAAGSYSFTWANQGGDNLGALLDDVLLEIRDGDPVPEPAALGLLGLGLLGISATRRRR